MAGRKKDKDSECYQKANLYREFGGKNSMDLRAANGETMSYSAENKDTWFEVGIGTNVRLSNKTYIYGDILRTFGADVTKKWQVNAGVRWAFGGPKPLPPVPPVVIVPEPVPPVVQREFYLDTIYFDFDKSNIRESEVAKLQRFIQTAKENPEITYAMVGNTCDLGTNDYNMNLSHERVGSVKEYAKNAGVPAERMEDSYLGEDSPAYPNDNETNRSKNRRVEIYEHK